MFEIIPSILTNSPQEALSDLEKLNDVILPHGFPLDRVQIDIVDGQFAENKTIEPDALANIETKLKLDFHLMTSEPIDWVERCVRAGGERNIGQIELMANQFSFVGKVQEVGLAVGLALNIDTEIERLDDSLLSSLDVVLLMSYPAGMGGQEFDIRVLDKVKRLVGMRGENIKPFKICVDGGVTPDNIKSVKMAGADEVVIGKRLISGDIEENFEKFYKALY
ncbi:hypothetical protein A3A76_00930 [Candidatus Woesebacteria bacterium RIFCSPLOWO2_01_FULL_39_23]|uniref:Ribulose-phosphate 3-epimerase n=1 Tax=Candidatus Woesebacteria bacterium RIFCSPHIGHO2_01_FULL_40_22 TaxID=1802499 RepID=A0A1F7YJU6_9BACT|nr:MAG: hypothetical protein A2141_05575 [Candidatus Woesebacteria bacterium RBG_16_40_11]OGM26805.1 MAG: hypothetical protein A2628_04605 [Candidatus Woesebacteria bacterium RIFCSPHIGHO2_01_FULL_40_22]OGM35731.1 MAG: hypothetical protein A3E41_03685 [Candidatus Woesebacteria bacterium RIFCSPHIGHO2_12_FULL_38_9]OGM63102.1 MAG: hypothetical protein A3A76_00930 [Candidatus Woesebacteria bacterium RIFCSPLOWO2_01_FULL_39_23]